MSNRATPTHEDDRPDLGAEPLLDASAYAESIFESAREPLLLLDGTLRIRAANRAFYDTFHAAPAATIGPCIFDLGNGQWNIPRLRAYLESVLQPWNGPRFDLELSHEFQDIGHRILMVSAYCAYPAVGPGNGIFVSFQDVTATRQAWETLQRLNEDLQERVRRRTDELEAAHRELERLGFSTAGHVRHEFLAEKEARQAEVVPADLPVCYLMPAASSSVVKDCRHRKVKAGKHSAPLLTRRQRRVLQLLAEGNSCKEIARVLGVAVRTAEACRTQIMAALDIKDIAGLKDYAIQIGIVRSES